MRLLRLDEVPIGERDRVFRHSPARALFAALTAICASAVFILLGWQGGSVLAYYLAAITLLGLLLMRRLIVARFQPSNWLVRLSDAGLYVQFRSYLNYHLPKEDPTVVFIPHEEIRSVRLVRQRRDIPDMDGARSQLNSVSAQRRSLVEINLAADSSLLARALADELRRRGPEEAHWYGHASTLYKDYPARLASPGSLQLEWKAVPRARIFLAALQRYTDIKDSVEVSEDYLHLEGLSREEQERRLRELVETGQTISAIRIARRLYSYDLTQAKAFVDSLLARKGTRPPS
jgi:hypothetical protein